MLTCALVISSLGSLLSQTSETQNGSTSTAAIVLGVGSPNIDAERSGTSIGVMAAGRLYVFDAGAGVERRIMEASPKLATRKVQKFGPVFISHLHFDHTIGLAALISYHNFNSKSLLTGGGDLTVYGPGPVNGAPGIGAVIDHYRGAGFFGGAGVAPGIRAEELGGGILQVQAIELKSGVVYRDSSVVVTAFEVAHKSAIAFGFRVQTADRVIVISGDTRPVDAVIEACNGCDLLFHEVFDLSYGAGGPTGDAQGHTSAAELGELARRARPKHLVIYHDVRAPHDAALEVIGRKFPGKVTFARDLDIF